MEGARIRVNVYDLTKVNSLFRKSKLGVYHTSVVVGDAFEVYYGFYKTGCTGVDYANHINMLPSSMSGTFYSSYDLGTSEYTIEECKRIARQMSLREEWLSNRYNILNHNCHAFALEYCKAILCPHKLLNFPAYVFKGESVGSALYDNFLSIFIDENNPPYFLNKQPYRKEEHRPSSTIIQSPTKRLTVW